MPQPRSVMKSRRLIASPAQDEAIVAVQTNAVKAGLYVCFSNRPVWVKRLQTSHRSGVNVTHGLVLLFGIGATALPSWGSRTRRNNLWVGLAAISGRSKQTYDLTSFVVPRGTSYHRTVELASSPIAFDFALSCCCSLLAGPAEFSAVTPDAMHDHSQATSQRYDCLFHAAALGDLHRPGLEPGPPC